jgi:hypothetical protein
MGYEEFYNAFLQSYFGCFTCNTSKDIIMDLMDLDDDGRITWEEWRTWLLWAFRQQGKGVDDIRNLDDLHKAVFRQALLPLHLKNKGEQVPPAKKLAKKHLGRVAHWAALEEGVKKESKVVLAFALKEEALISAPVSR